MQELADQRTVFQHPVVVDRHGDEPDVPRERRIEHGAAEVVEQAELRRAQPAVTREAALEEDALRHAVAGDELDVPLEHGVIQRLAEAASHEVGAEGFEDVFEGPGTGPLAHRVAQVHPAGQHVGDHDIVSVGAVVHQIYDDVLLRNGLERRYVLIIDADLVEQVDEQLGEVVADLVVGQDVEIRHDLVHVGDDAASDGGLRERVRAGVGGDGRCDHRIAR